MTNFTDKDALEEEAVWLLAQMSPAERRKVILLAVRNDHFTVVAARALLRDLAAQVIAAAPRAAQADVVENLVSEIRALAAAPRSAASSLRNGA